MEQWKYNKREHQVDEQPTMGVVNITDADIEKLKTSLIKEVARGIQEEYKSLRHIPVSGEVEWEDGEDVTGKFKEQYQVYNGYIWYNSSKADSDTLCLPESQIRIVAIPIKQEQPQEDNWVNSAFENMGQQPEYLENQSQEQPVTDEDELWNEVGTIFNNSVSFKGYRHFLDKLEKQFTIKRK